MKSFQILMHIDNKLCCKLHVSLVCMGKIVIRNILSFLNKEDPFPFVRKRSKEGKALLDRIMC